MSKYMNMAGYTKLFNSILASTIWREDDKTRIVWITLLAMSDKNGVAEGSIPGLADMARVSVEDCERALIALSSPDKYSRTKEYEGRRIESLEEGGWQILNHGKYRAKMSADERRDYNKNKQAEWRARQKVSNIVNDSQSLSAMSAHTEAEAEAKAEAKADTKEVKKRALLASEGAIFPDDFPETHKPPLALWWEHKREKGQSYKPTGWKTLCTQQARKSADQVLRDVEFSIANNYAGIFADKQSASEIKAPERYFYEHPDIHSIPTFAEELREAFIENHDITDPKYQKIIATFDRRVVETAREL